MDWTRSSVRVIGTVPGGGLPAGGIIGEPGFGAAALIVADGAGADLIGTSAGIHIVTGAGPVRGSLYSY